MRDALVSELKWLVWLRELLTFGFRKNKRAFVFVFSDQNMWSYTKERKQFGSRIADFQGMQFMLARSAMEVEAARLMV